MDIAKPTGSNCVKDSRGVAVADFNNDGKLDLVISNNNETPTLYFNNIAKSGNFVTLQLVGGASNRDAIGTVVRVAVNGKTMMRQVEAGSGYASEALVPLHFGLGANDKIEAVEIKWANGATQRFDKSQAADWVGKQIRIEEGSAQAIKVPLNDKNPKANRVAAAKNLMPKRAL